MIFRAERIFWLNAERAIPHLPMRRVLSGGGERILHMRILECNRMKMKEEKDATN